MSTASGRQPVFCQWCGNYSLKGNRPAIYLECYCPAFVEAPDLIRVAIQNMNDSREGKRWRKLIKRCEHPSALSILTEFLETSADDRSRIAIAEAIANIADTASLELMSREFQEGAGWEQAIRYVGRLKTEVAAPVLAKWLEHPDKGDHVAYAAAWHKVAGVTDRLIDLVDRHPGHPKHARMVTSSNPKAIKALIRLGESDKLLSAISNQVLAIADVENLVASTIERTKIGGTDELLTHQLLHELSDGQGPPTPYDPDRRRAEVETRARASHDATLRTLLGPVLRFDRPALHKLLSEVHRLSGLDIASLRIVPQSEENAPAVERCVEAWTLDFEKGDINHPGTRIGGQPTWLATPTWPLNEVGGPLSFWGQFEIPWTPGALAYLFIDPADGSMAMTEDGEAVLFVQPGFAPNFPYRPIAAGPNVPLELNDDDRFQKSSWFRNFDGHVPSMKPFLEPTSFYDETGRWQGGPDDESFDAKIGGSPISIQGEPVPPDEHYRFLFEFPAWAAGHELADIAQCYGYIKDETGEGWFNWDCH